MSRGSYTLQQQTFTLSILANSASLQKGEAGALQSWLAQEMTARLQSATFRKYIGEWALVWGPVTWEQLDTAIFIRRADNVMLAAQNRTTKDIVVAIAGTNMHSLYDAVEDLDVGSTVPFNGTPGAWISRGTYDGLRQLVVMRDPHTGQTLFEYLSGLKPVKGNLIFTGHSLGGALAPALALDYVVNHKLPRRNFGNVYVYPSAGPTPGNAELVKLFVKTFPAGGGSGFNVWNQNVRNSLDAIPRVWAEVASLPALYPPLNGGKPIHCIETLVQKALVPAMKGNVYADLPYSMFLRPFDPNVRPPVPGATCAWFAQIVEQHLDQYYQEITPELRSSLPVLATAQASVCLALDAWCVAKRLL